QQCELTCRPNSLMNDGGGKKPGSYGKKPSGGRFAVASSMNWRHIRAGYVAPCTAPPGRPTIGSSPFGFPIQTAAVYWGVKPTNHASTLLSVVPVLPAIGRGNPLSVPLAVPNLTTS